MADEKPKVSLGDLLNEIGGKKIRFQVLGHVLDGEQRTRKDGTTCFKFASQENLSDVMAGRREALIVWVDGGEIEAARQRLIDRYGPPTPGAVAGPEKGEQP